VIDLLVHDDRTGVGLMGALDVERIPYRLIEHAGEMRAGVLVAAGAAVTPEVSALARRVPALLVGAPASIACEALGMQPSPGVEGPASIDLGAAVWPADVRAAAERFGTSALRLPCASFVAPRSAPAGETLATLVETGTPAVVRRGPALWCLIDLGRALADLQTERGGAASPAPNARPMPRAALAAYYRLPEGVRAVLQRRVYARLEQTLATAPSPSAYPVDTTGWLLVELVKTLVKHAAGGWLVRLARWPAPFTAAAALTHDLEPSRYAYGPGLEQLLARIARRPHPATFGVVARPARRHLRGRALAALREGDVLCHGLEHRGETLQGDRETIARGLASARAGVEALIGRPMAGFRSPRLDRSPDLLWALDQVGFSFDSSYPDVDRENVHGFGGGVRLNVPYRPPLEGEDGRVRPSRCLELPVSAPDCIQPLFAGEDTTALRRAVSQKVDFVRATAGLYMGIVHAGVFGRADAARRGAHLEFVRETLAGQDLWLASATEVADWWCLREQVALGVVGGAARVTNESERRAAGVRVVVEQGDDATVHELPVLDPGGSAQVLLPGASGRARAALPAGA
jgi:hypothetical protein